MTSKAVYDDIDQWVERCILQPIFLWSMPTRIIDGVTRRSRRLAQLLQLLPTDSGQRTDGETCTHPNLVRRYSSCLSGALGRLHNEPRGGVHNYLESTAIESVLVTFTVVMQYESYGRGKGQEIVYWFQKLDCSFAQLPLKNGESLWKTENMYCTWQFFILVSCGTLYC